MLSAAVRISQPSLSHAIVQMEQELGVPLFEKNGRNVELTQFGEVFLKQVRQSLEILDGSVDYLHRIAAGNGVVRLGLLRALGVEYALKNNPDEKAVKLLVKQIDVSGDKKNNVFNIQSTLNTLLEIMECKTNKDVCENPLFARLCGSAPLLFSFFRLGLGGFSAEGGF